MNQPFREEPFRASIVHNVSRNLSKKPGVTLANAQPRDAGGINVPWEGQDGHGNLARQQPG